MKKNDIGWCLLLAFIILLILLVGIWLFGGQVLGLMGVASSSAVGSHEANDRACEVRASSSVEGSRWAESQGMKAARADEGYRDSRDEDEKHTSPRDSFVKPISLPDDGGPMPSEAFK